jgi:Berberine and berberine like
MMDDEGEARVQAAYGGSYDRLATLKTKYDPANVLPVNQNIRPGLNSRSFRSAAAARRRGRKAAICIRYFARIVAAECPEMAQSDRSSERIRTEGTGPIPARRFG